MPTEYKTVDTTTIKGLKEAERLHSKEWKTNRVGLFTIQFYRVTKKASKPKKGRNEG